MSLLQAGVLTLAPRAARKEPPSYSPPQSYWIGSLKTPPFVEPAHLKGHLALLHAFHELRCRVESLQPTEQVENRRGPRYRCYPHLPAEKDRKWSWFVGLAAQRFRLWYRTLNSLTEITVYRDMLFPPIDVLMVGISGRFHAIQDPEEVIGSSRLLLNPGWFSEDIDRNKNFTLLHAFASQLGELLPRMPDILSRPIAVTREQLWNDRCHVPFDPFEYASIANETVDDIFCPSCSTYSRSELMTTDGKGYLQERYRFVCPSCGLVARKSLLGARKMILDILSSSRPLAGTYFSPAIHAASQREVRSDTIKANLSRMFPENLHYQDYLEQNQHQADAFFQRCELFMPKGGGKLLPRIISAYFDDGPFSVDLAPAVLRQSSFTAKMYKLGWTEPNYFDNSEKERALVHCIARYHAFFDLMTSGSGSFLVPTLDIDLAWHTHQLMPKKYEEDCWKYVGRFVDHDDKVKESKLSDAFDETARAWARRFGTRYTHCGCPKPGARVRQSLSSALSLPNLSRHSSRYKNNPYFDYDSSFISPVDRDDLAAATHPSEHPAVFVSRESDALGKDRADREARTHRREEKEEINIHAEGKNRAKLEDVASAARRLKLLEGDKDQKHDIAFLTPVPLHYYSPMSPCAPYGSILNGRDCAVGADVGGGGGTSCGSGCGVVYSRGGDGYGALSSSGGESSSGSGHGASHTSGWFLNYTSCSSGRDDSGGGDDDGGGCGGGCGG